MRWLLALIVQLASFAAAAQDTVHFPSFDAGDGRPATELTGYLFKPNRPGPMPAVISSCKALVDGAVTRGAAITWQVYPDAWHDSDRPNLKRKELTAYTTRDGVVPITGEDPAARANAIQRVQGFLAQHIALH